MNNSITQNEPIRDLKINSFTNRSYDLLLKAQGFIKLKAGFFCQFKKSLMNYFTNSLLNKLRNHDIDHSKNKKRKSKSDKSVKDYLFTSENFNLLCKAQERIFGKTGFSPSIRKLINSIVNNKSVKEITNQFIENLK